jgi:tetratricopeptide (TPR) repeat protein
MQFHHTAGRFQVITSTTAVEPERPPTGRQQLEGLRDQLRAKVLARPEDSRTFLHLAEVQLQLGEAEDCLLFAQQLCSQCPGATWRSAARAVLEGLRQPTQAVTLLEDVTLRLGRTAAAAEVFCFLAKLQPHRMEFYYRQALEIAPRSVAVLLGLADCSRKADRHDDAAHFFEAALKIEPLSSKHLFHFGEALILSGRGSAGKDRLQEVLQQPDKSYHVRALATLALAHVIEQQLHPALEFSRKAANMFETQSQGTTRPCIEELRLAKFVESWALLRSGHLDAAAHTLQSLPFAGRSNSSFEEQAQTLLAYIQVLQGNVHFAEKSIEKARGSLPNCSSVTLSIAGYVHLIQGKFDTAEQTLREALLRDPSSSEALLRMGQLLLRQQKLEVAVEYLQKALRQSLDTPSFGLAERCCAHVYLCLAHHYRGTALNSSLTCIDALARQHLHRALEFWPDLRTQLPDIVSSSRTIRRIGLLDLFVEEASILLIYMSEGVASAVAAAPHPFEDRFALVKAPPLVGTVSTAAPPESPRHVPLLASFASDRSLGVFESLVGSVDEAKILRLEDIELLELLSRGEMTTVHRGIVTNGTLQGLGVVVKAVQPRGNMQEDAVVDLLAEIQLMAQLCHPCIAVFVGASVEPGRLALVTELAAGGNLHQALHLKRRDYTRTQRFGLATDLLQGVRYLHTRTPPIAHLDLKSMNLVLDADGLHPRICDFGLARVLGSDGGTTGTFLLCDSPESSPSGRCNPVSRGGSPRYMAPECYDETLGPLTEKTDVWSSGCILIEIFGSCQPYAECSNVQQILKIMLVQHSPPTIPAEIEVNVAQCIHSMLVFDAAERMSVDEVLLRLTKQ